MPTFDRFDICAAYLAAENEWNVGGWLRERPSNRRRGEATSIQLARIQYREGANAHAGSFEGLSENGREIYNLLCERWRLGDGGYKPCACRDCMEIAIGWGNPLCHACREAQCEPNRECKAPGAYGEDEETES